jgi:hypothetical protein
MTIFPLMQRVILILPRPVEEDKFGLLSWKNVGPNLIRTMVKLLEVYLIKYSMLSLVPQRFTELLEKNLKKKNFCGIRSSSYKNEEELSAVVQRVTLRFKKWAW